MFYKGLENENIYKPKMVYFKNPLDEMYEVKYNELSYYESSKEWVLGEGFHDEL